ncbi:MAG: tetratricopeptide repeat protein [Pedobacter sp.]|nr:tetratricopeptide repeat protein [Pedobacter sp.]
MNVNFSIKNTFALSALAAALFLAGCASTPKQQTPAETAGPEAPAESNEPDLVAQLRERMAAGTLQRQEKTEDRQPSAATADSSKSPTVTVDLAKQQAAAAVGADYAKALGLMSNGKDDDALAILKGVSQKAPQFSGPLVNEGLIYLRKQQYADAEKVLQEAVKVNPQNPYAFNLLGVALRELGKFPDAKAAYESALALDPNYAKAHFNLGVLADLYMQDLPLALSHYQRYQTLQGKPDPAVANWIIDLQKRTGTYVPPAPLPAALPPPEETVEEVPADAAAPAAAEAPAAGDAPAANPAAEQPAAAPAEPVAAPAPAPAKKPVKGKKKS